MSLMTQVGLEFIARDKSRAGINSFRGNLSTTTRTVQSLGRSLLAVAGVGGGFYMLGNVLRGSFSEFADFEKGMAKVSTMLNAQTIKYLPAYSNEIRKMATEYGTSTEDMTEGLYKILSGQIKASEAMNVLSQSVESAKGGFASTADTVQASIRILNAYSMQLDQVNRVHDILHSTVREGLLDFSDLAQNIGNAIGVAAPLGAELEAVAAVMAVLTKTTQDADQAVTSLKNIFNQLKYPSMEQIEIARELGFAMNENSIKGAGLIKVLAGLQKADARQLSVLMPTIRGFAGFATALKNAGNVAEVYENIINSTGLKQENLSKAMATTSTQIDIATRLYGELKMVIGEELAPAFNDFMKEMNESVKSGEFVAGMHERIATVYEFADSMTNLDELFKLVGTRKWTYKDLAEQHRLLAEVARAKATQPELDAKVMAVKAAASPDRLFVGPPEPSAPAGDYAAVAARTNAQIVADTREKLASIRSMDTMTRMEKIQNLKAYMAEHSYTMDGVTEQEKLLTAEIISLISSRQDAMKVYMAELREDMQHAALYISDKFAEASRSIESGLSDAFLSLREKGSNFRSFMVNVFTSIQDSFAKMLADMAARVLMNATVAPLMNVLSGGLGSLFKVDTVGSGSVGYGGPGTPVTTGGKLHSGWVPEGVPSFRSGRGLKQNEMAAIIEKDELLAPADQIIRSPFSRAGSSAPSINIYNESGQQIEQKGQPEFDGEKWVVSLVAKNISQGGSLSKLIKR